MEALCLAQGTWKTLPGLGEPLLVGRLCRYTDFAFALVYHVHLSFALISVPFSPRNLLWFPASKGVWDVVIWFSPPGSPWFPEANSDKPATWDWLACFPSTPLLLEIRDIVQSTCSDSLVGKSVARGYFESQPVYSHTFTKILTPVYTKKLVGATELKDHVSYC